MGQERVCYAQCVMWMRYMLLLDQYQYYHGLAIIMRKQGSIGHQWSGRLYPMIAMVSSITDIQSYPLILTFSILDVSMTNWDDLREVKINHSGCSQQRTQVLIAIYGDEWFLALPGLDDGYIQLHFFQIPFPSGGTALVEVEGQLLGIDDAAGLQVLGVGLAPTLRQLDLRGFSCIFAVGEGVLLQAGVGGSSTGVLALGALGGSTHPSYHEVVTVSHSFVLATTGGVKVEAEVEVEQVLLAGVVEGRQLLTDGSSPLGDGQFLSLCGVSLPDLEGLMARSLDGPDDFLQRLLPSLGEVQRQRLQVLRGESRKVALFEHANTKLKNINYSPQEFYKQLTNGSIWFLPHTVPVVLFHPPPRTPAYLIAIMQVLMREWSLAGVLLS